MNDNEISVDIASLTELINKAIHQQSSAGKMVREAERTILYASMCLLNLERRWKSREKAPAINVEDFSLIDLDIKEDEKDRYNDFMGGQL